MRTAALCFASLVAFGGLTGCNTKQLGDWGPVGTRDDRADQPPAAARGKEVIELCGQVKMASSALCNDVAALKKKKKAGGH